MSMVAKVASLLEKVLGAQTEVLAKKHGVIQRKRKFTGQSLLRMLVVTLLKKPDAKYADWALTAAQMGVAVTATAVEKRFTQPLVDFLREALSVTLGQLLAAEAVSNELTVGSFHGALHWGQFQHSSPRRNADGVPRLRWYGRELCRSSQDSSAVGSQDGCVAASID